MWRRVWAVLTVFAALTSASACLWDADTLQAETAKFPDLVDTIVGWFPRNPPLYYEMRIQRRQRELKQSTKILNAYDDIAVGDARLGKEKDGLAALEQQRFVLQSLAQDDPDVKVHWYHYWANRGTLLAHEWFHNGHKASEISKLQEGEKALKQALKINPDAHFGRERVQLEVMQWAEDQVLHPSIKDKDPEEQTLGYYLGKQEVRWPPNGPNAEDVKKVLKGLQGLVVLGAAWESYDVFEAITTMLNYLGAGRVAQLARSRCFELAAKGLPSLNHTNPKALMVEFEPRDKSLVQSEDAEYTRVRKLADEENLRRENYMMPLLRAGRHPDTDPHFWDGFTPRKRPELRDPGLSDNFAQFGWIGAFAIVGILAIGAGVFIRLFRIRQLAKRA